MTKRRTTKREAKLHQELRDRANEIHDLKRQLNEATHPLRTEVANARVAVERIKSDMLALEERARAMLLWCPACGERHIDEGEFAAKLHHTHACQHCGMVWRPAIGPTFGVRHLPGFKNDPVVDLVKRLRDLRSSIAVVGHTSRPQEIIDELIGLVGK